ncbi:MAG: hypothetical protein MK538_11755 [Planctomycetes bacterium]|nr:hypothetical protein [Planctomycetota bacterium]
MAETSRRNVLRAGAAALAGFAGGSNLGGRKKVEAHQPATGKASKWDHEYTFGHTQLFMEEYLQGTLDILGKQSGEIEHVGELAIRAASVVRNRGTVWTSMDLGHMPHYEQNESRRGSPGIMKDHRDFNKLKKGDMVFTHRANRDVLAARERGVYVVCVTSNYHDNEFRPKGFTDPSHGNPDGLMLKDVSNDVLHSHNPYTQGLVHAPEIPEFAICPSSTTGSGTIHWMINAGLAAQLKNRDNRPGAYIERYLRILTERVESVRQHLSLIRETAVEMTHRIRSGGRWFARSIEHKGFETEFHVASGVRVVNHGDWNANKERNVMLINAISPAFKEEVKLALEKQVEGALVIGIGPSNLDGRKPYGPLIDIADAGFDNFSPESGGVIDLAPYEGGICPTSGIVGNVIQQMIVAQWCDEMVRRGSRPYFLMGVYQEGGSEYNAATKILFERQGF